MDVVGAPGSGSSATRCGASGGVRRSPPRQCCRSPSGSGRTPPSSAFSIPWCCARCRFVIRPRSSKWSQRRRGSVRELDIRALRTSKVQPKTIAGAFQVDPTSTMSVLVDGRCRCGRRAAGHRRLLQRAGHRSGHRHRDRASRRARVDHEPRRRPRLTPTGRAGSGATLASSAGRSRSTRSRTRLSA